MMPPDSWRLDLGAFLLRRTVDPFHALTEASGNGAAFYHLLGSELQPVSTAPEVPTASDLVILALLARPTTPPAWETFVREGVGVPGFGADRGDSLGAAVFCATPDPEDGGLRWIVWTFGSASRSVRRRAVDSRFGLIVALNLMTLIRPDVADEDVQDRRREGAVRQLQFRTPSPYPQQTGVRASRDVPVEGTRLDRMVDLVSAVGGRTGDPALSQVFGSRAVRYTDDVSGVDDLVKASSHLMEEFRQHRYQQSFGWIDRYALVEDDVMIDRLRGEVARLVRTSDPSVDVMLPDELTEFGDDRSVQYIGMPDERKAAANGRTVLTLGTLAQYAGHSKDDAFLDRELRFFDTKKDLIDRVPILDCLTAELDNDGQRFVLFDGDFYVVDAGFLESINQQLNDLALTTLDLPCYSGGDEAIWNKAVVAARPSEYVCLDGTSIVIPHEGKFEPCDVVALRGAMIHAKRKSRSSTLTYVFTQAERSCQMLSELPGARHQLDDLISDKAPDPSTATAAIDVMSAFGRKPVDLEVVIAILGDWKDRSLVNLPLLSKITLLASFRRLAQVGFRPTVAMVGLCSHS